MKRLFDVVMEDMCHDRPNRYTGGKSDRDRRRDTDSLR